MHGRHGWKSRYHGWLWPLYGKIWGHMSHGYWYCTLRWLVVPNVLLENAVKHCLLTWARKELASANSMSLLPFGPLLIQSITGYTIDIKQTRLSSLNSLSKEERYIKLRIHLWLSSVSSIRASTAFHGQRAYSHKSLWKQWIKNASCCWRYKTQLALHLYRQSECVPYLEVHG